MVTAMRALSLGELWRRGQVGWPRRYPVAQFPNPPLIAAAAGVGLAAAADGAPGDAGRVLWISGVAVWAWQEVADGANAFRRSLGAGALAGLAAHLAGKI
jgi:hypothetical protein